MGLQVDGSEQGIGRQADEIAINKLRTYGRACGMAFEQMYVRTYVRTYVRPKTPPGRLQTRPDNPAAYPLLGANGCKPQAMVLGFRV